MHASGSVGRGSSLIAWVIAESDHCGALVAMIASRLKYRLRAFLRRERIRSDFALCRDPAHWTISLAGSYALPAMGTRLAFDQLAARYYCAVLRTCRMRIPIAIAGPIPSAKRTVPKPSVPPKAQPIATTVSSRKVRTSAMG